jgi:ATP-dependent Clp protease adaptor protein ClpS
VDADPRQATEERTTLAPMFRVLVHNDDLTPFEFVIVALVEMFRKNPQDAMRITAEADKEDVALVEILPWEQAEFRIGRAHAFARANHFPLKFTCEPA